MVFILQDHAKTVFKKICFNLSTEILYILQCTRNQGMIMLIHCNQCRYQNAARCTSCFHCCNVPVTAASYCSTNTVNEKCKLWTQGVRQCVKWVLLLLYITCVNKKINTLYFLSVLVKKFGGHHSTMS